MIVAGVDYSMSSPSICVYDTESGDLSHQNCFYFYKQVVPSIKEMNRICQLDLINIFPGYQSKFEDEFTKVFCLADWGYSIIREMKVELVALESYAFGASGRVFNIAEATGLFKMFLRLNKIPLLTFVKNSIKLTLVITFLQVITSCLAAYGFAKIEFKGRNFLFLFSIDKTQSIRLTENQLL